MSAPCVLGTQAECLLAILTQVSQARPNQPQPARIVCRSFVGRAAVARFMHNPRLPVVGTSRWEAWQIN